MTLDAREVERTPRTPQARLPDTPDGATRVVERKPQTPLPPQQRLPDTPDTGPQPDPNATPNQVRINPQTNQPEVYFNGQWTDFYTVLLQVSQPQPIDYDAIYAGINQQNQADRAAFMDTQQRYYNDQRAAQQAQFDQQRAAELAARRGDFQSRVGSYYNAGQQRLNDSFASRGLNYNDPMYRAIYDQELGNLDNMRTQAMSATGNDFDFRGIDSYSGANNALNSLQNTFRQQYQTQAGQLPQFSLDNDFVNNTISDLVGSRFSGVDTAFNLNKERGVYAPQQIDRYNTMRSQMQGQYQNQLQSRASPLQTEFNTRMQSNRDSAINMGKNYQLGQTAPDYASLGTQWESDYNTRRDTFDDDISSGLGANPTLADFFGARSVGGSNAAVPGGAGGLGEGQATGFDNRNRQRSRTSRGLGSTGVF